MMVKKIGRGFCSLLFLMLISLSTIRADDAIALELVDMRGKPVESVAVDTPFKIRVRVFSDGSAHADSPEIVGINQFQISGRQTSSHFTRTQGAMTVERIYDYAVRAYAPGTYSVGPASVSTSTGFIKSKPLCVAVVQEAASADDTQTDGRPAFIELVADKQSVYEGEPIVVTYRFVHEPDVRLAKPLAINLNHNEWIVGSQYEPTMGTTVVGGKEYRYEEQKIELYSYVPGQHVMPSLVAQCLIESRHPSAGFFGFEDFFGLAKEPYSARSNKLSVTVLPLPDHEPRAQATGVFTQFTARVDATTARQGQGIVVTLELVGSGDMLHIASPALMVPPSFSSYESKTDIYKHGSSAWAKSFEYIVQGKSPGTYELPAQSFVYFNPKTKSYDTLLTNPITLTIEPVPVQNVSGQLPTQSQYVTVTKEDELKPLVGYGDAYRSHKARWSHFFGWGSILLLSILFIIACFRMIRSFGEKNDASYRHVHAFKKARKLLRRYKKKGDVSLLHALLRELFADYFGVAQEEVTEQFVRAKLHELGVHEQKVEQMIQRFLQISERAFFSHVTAPSDEALFTLLESFINELESFV